MSFPTLQTLLQTTGRLYPYSSERFMRLVTEIEEHPFKEVLKADALHGPVEKVQAYFSAWLENLNTISDADGLSEEWRTHLEKLAAAHPDVFDFLPNWTVRFVCDYQNHLSPTALQSCWENLNASVRYADRCVQLNIIARQAESIARETVEGFEEVHPLLGGDDDFSEFNTLRVRLAKALAKWAEDSKGEAPLAQDLSFIRHFLTTVAPLHQGGEVFWQSFLTVHFEGILQRQLAAYPRRLLSEPLACLVAASDRFDCLLDFRAEASGLVGNWDAEKAEFLDLVLGAMVMRSLPGSQLRNQFFHHVSGESLTGELAEVLQAFQAARPKICEWMRARHDRSRVDWFEDTLELFSKLARTSDATDRAIDLWHADFLKTGEDLAVGVKGQNLAKRCSYLIQETFRRAVWGAAVEADARFAASQFRRGLIANLGVDYSEEVWRKHSRIQAKLVSLAGDPAGRELVTPALPLLRLIDQIVPATRPATRDFALEPLAGEDTGVLSDEELLLMVRRIVLEIKLSPERNLAEGVSSWFYEFELSRIGASESPAVADQLKLLGNRVLSTRDGLSVPALLLSSLERLSDSIPELSSALLLGTTAETMVQATPRELQKDNVRTLARLSVLFNPVADFSQKDFTGWWSRSVADIHFSRGGEELFKRNLEGLYQGLAVSFDPLRAGRLFGVLQEVCKEVTGVGVTIAALSFRAFAQEGTWWRRLQGAGATALPVCAFAGEAILAGFPQASQPAQLPFLKVWMEAAAAFQKLGDAEQAWWSVRSSLERLQATSSASNLLSALSDVGFNASEAVGGEKAGPWLLLLEAGLEQAQQLSLGRKLATLENSLGETISKAVYLSHPDEFGEGASRLQATVAQWTSLLRRASECMRTQPPSLARLNTGRHFVELVLPSASFDVAVWRSLSNALSVTVGPVLDNSDRALWLRWLALLEPLAHSAPALVPVAIEVFRSEEYVFSPKGPEEDEIRALVSSALVLSTWNGILGHSVISRLAARTILASELPALKNADEIVRILTRVPDLLSASLPPGIHDALKALREAFERASRLAGLIPGWPAALVVPCCSGQPDYFWRMFRLPALGDAAGDALLGTADTPLQVVCGRTVNLPELSRRRGFLHTVWRFDSTLRPTARRISQVCMVAAGLADSDKAVSSAAVRLSRAFGHGSELLLPDSQMDAGNLLRLSCEAPPECAWAEILSGLPMLLARLRSGLTLQIKSSELADAVGGSLAGQTGLTRLTKALAPPRLHLFFQRLGACLLEESQPPPVLLAQVFSASCRSHGFGPVTSLYAQMALQISEQLAPEVQRHASEILWRSQINPTSLTTTGWAEIFAASRGDTPEFLGAACLLAPELARRAAEVVAPGMPGVVPAVLAGALEEILVALIRPLARGGDVEEGWFDVLRTLDTRLDTVAASAVEAGLLALRPLLADKVAAPAIPFWHQLVTHAVGAVQQAAAGRKLSTRLAAVSSGIVQQWAPEEGSAPDQAERDTHLLLVLFSHLGSLLRTQPPTVLWLNFGRWWVENLLPYQESGRENWQSRLRLLEDILLPECDPTESAGLLHVSAGLIQLGGAAPAVRPLASALFSTEGTLPGGDEQLPACFVSGIIASALLPDSAVVPGRALLQRLFLSHAELASRGETGWRSTSSVLLSSFNKLSSNQLPAAVTKRLADLPRTAGIIQGAVSQKGHGLSYFCGILSGWPVTRQLWLSSLLARTNPASGLGSQGPGDLMITQQVGWELPGDADLQGRLRLCSGVWAMGDRFPVRPAENTVASAPPPPPPEPVKRGFFGFGRSSTPSSAPAVTAVKPSLVFAPEWHPHAAVLLRSLTLRQVLAPEVPIEVWISQDRSHFPFVPEDSPSRLAFLQAVQRHLLSQFGDRAPVSQAFAEYVRLWAGFALAQRLVRADRGVVSATASPLGLPASSASAALRFCGLMALGLRSADDSAAYSRSGPGAASVNVLQKILSAPEALQASLAKSVPAVEAEALASLLPTFKSTLLA